MLQKNIVFDKQFLNYLITDAVKEVEYYSFYIVLFLFVILYIN